MRHRSELWLVGVVMAVGMLCSGAPVAAQAQKAPAAKQAEVKKEPAKRRGPLPAYYGQVVTPQQREKIYTIQQTYTEQIEALQTQLKELQAKLAAECKAVLTADQVKKIEELAAAAKTKGQPTEEAAEKTPEVAPAKAAAQATTKK